MVPLAGKRNILGFKTNILSGLTQLSLSYTIAISISTTHHWLKNLIKNIQYMEYLKQK